MRAPSKCGPFAAVVVMESRRYLSTGLAALLAALVTVALSAWPAQAAEPATSFLGAVQVTPDTVEVGEAIGLSAVFSPCSADESLTVSLGGKSLPVSNVVEPAESNNFTFTADAVVPPSQPGSYEVEVGCSTESLDIAENQFIARADGSVYVVTLTPSAQMVQAGQSLVIAGRGFTQCTTVDLSAGETLLAVASGSNGDFQQVIPVPLATPAGLYPVTAKCPDQPGNDLVSANVYVATLALSPGSGNPDTTISATGGGYQCDEVQLQLLRGGIQVVAAGRPVVPTNGVFTAEVTVPSGAVPGSDYQVGAGCYPAADGTAPIAIEPFTVTPAPLTSGSPAGRSTSASSTSSSPTQPGTGSSSPTSPSPQPGTGSSSSTSPSPQLGTGSASSSGLASAPRVTAPQSTVGSGGSGTPVALVGSSSAGLAVVALLLVRALSVVHGRRGRSWVNKHLRVTAGRAEAWSASVERRPGAASISVGLQPHPGHFGDQQQYEEAVR
jgi:hypothetical protein